MIQITQTRVQSDNHQVEDLRKEFHERKTARLPGLIENSLLEQVMGKLETTGFLPKTEGESGDEFGKVLFVPNTQPVLFLFQLLMNRPELFRIIQQITNCQTIGNFFGRIHRSSPGPEHHIAWHGDNADYRMVGMSINLSNDTFSGGLFQLRHKASGRILSEISNTDRGDAFIFSIDPELQHRLLPVADGGNRTVAVGWFRSQPDHVTFARNFFISRFQPVRQESV